MQGCQFCLFSISSIFLYLKHLLTFFAFLTKKFLALKKIFIKQFSWSFLLFVSLLIDIFILNYSIETKEEHDYRSLPEKLHLTGYQGFTLTYSVDWPLSLVIDNKSIFCYQLIFRHLFYCKYVEGLLCKLV